MDFENLPDSFTETLGRIARVPDVDSQKTFPVKSRFKTEELNGNTVRFSIVAFFPNEPEHDFGATGQQATNHFEGMGIIYASQNGKGESFIEIEAEQDSGSLAGVQLRFRLNQAAVDALEVSSTEEARFTCLCDPSPLPNPLWKFALVLL